MQMADAGVRQAGTGLNHTMRHRAIIFDCDGTLVDSERVGNAAIVEYLAELGLRITLDDALTHFAGRKMADTLSLIEHWLGSPLPTDFLPKMRLRMAAAFEAELQPMAGVPDLLQRLPLPYCVASNGPHDKMQISLRATGLLGFFAGRIYSAYDCQSWKPEPGLFLHAARSMGMAPRDCAVVEDSALGIEAAIAAGMTAYGYAPHDDGARLAALGARVFHDMRELEMLLFRRS